MGTTPVFQSKHNSIIILVLLTFYMPYIAVGVSKMLCFYIFLLNNVLLFYLRFIFVSFLLLPGEVGLWTFCY